MNILRNRFAGRTAGMVAILLGLTLSAPAAIGQISLSINAPGVSIGINVPSYPQLIRVPGYPVYYAPRLQSNYFFYDGMYWVYLDDNWYASSWYNGPWALVTPVAVPLYVLRIPVRYYRSPPTYFRGWRMDGPPRWGEHWGRDWEQRRRGWDRWNRQSAPAAAPLPIYQRQYRGERYPDAARQAEIVSRNYHYRPRDEVVRQHYEEHVPQRAPAPSEQRAAPRTRDERIPSRQAPQQDMRTPQPPMPLPSPRAEAPVQPNPQPRPQPMPRPPQQQAPQQQAPQQEPSHRQPPQRQAPPHQAPQQPPPQHQAPQQPPPRAPAAMPPPQQQQHVPPRAGPERQAQPEQPGRAPPPSSRREGPGDRGQPHEGRPERGKDKDRDRP